MILGPVGPETKNGCAGEVQQQITRLDHTRPDQGGASGEGQQQITSPNQNRTGSSQTPPLVEEGSQYQNS
jgi:hypothetical protein